MVYIVCVVSKVIGQTRTDEFKITVECFPTDVKTNGEVQQRLFIVITLAILNHYSLLKKSSLITRWETTITCELGDGPRTLQTPVKSQDMSQES